MPTGPDDEPPVQDGPGEPDASVVPEGFESFLSAVRGMIHGDDEPVVEPVQDEAREPVAEAADVVPDDVAYVEPEVEAPAGPSPDAWVAEEESSDWLPGTWVVDAPTAPRRRADRGMEKSLARQEKKLRDQERRNARGSRKRRRGSVGEEPEVGDRDADVVAPVSRIPAQADPMSLDRPPAGEPAPDRPGAETRPDRRQRRRDAARAQAVSDESGAELVPSGPAPAVETSRGSRRSSRRERRREAAGGAGVGGPGESGESDESGETPTHSGAMSETAPMSQLGTDGPSTLSSTPPESTPPESTPPEPTPPESGTPEPSRAERRLERRLAKRTRRADARAAAIQRQVGAEAAKVERDEQRRLAKAEKREARLDQKLSRKAASAAKRERHADEVAARKEAEAEARALHAAENDVAATAAAEERQRLTEEKAAREAEQAEAAARERERSASEQEARAAAQAAARAAEERQRREAELARLETRATARADKDARRLAKRAARADARAMAEAEALDRRQDRRVRRIEKRRTRADARSAAEIEDLERRRERRARRLKKRSDRAAAKSRDEAQRLEQRRDEIERLASELPVATPDTGLLDGAFPIAPPEDAPVLPDSRSRRERRRDVALAKQLARAADGEPTPDAHAAEEESLADYLGRVEASILPWRSRRSRSRVPLRVRRAARIGAVCVLIGGAAVLPWAAPRVPGLIADAVPGGGSHVAKIKDPPVAPRTKSVAGPVGIATETNPLDGQRLASAGWPRRVVVPRLHVDSTVVPISGQSGSLLPPSDPQVLGWWREGRPVGSQFGSAVITGHTVHSGGGALDNLDKLAVGDTLRVRTDDGWISYVVQRAKIYSTAELARDADDIFRLGGPGRLVMITCDNWNGTFYESNAVVFASPTTDDPFEGVGVGRVPDPGPGSS